MANSTGLLRYRQQMNRHDRAMKQPLYLLDKFYKSTEGTTDEHDKIAYNYDHLVFKICGSTKNIYTVELKNNTITCDCPDYESGCVKYQVICKHCCFVLFKVLRLLDDIFQCLKRDGKIILMDQHINYLKHRFATLVMSAQLNSLRGDVLVDQTMLSKYLEMKAKKNVIGPHSSIPEDSVEPHCYNNKFIYSGDIDAAKEKCDVCPICFGEFDLSTTMAVCPKCRNILHLDCAKKWINMGNSTCVYCRSEVWKEYEKEELRERNTYTNLGK
jgi:hypothetical protein